MQKPVFSDDEDRRRLLTEEELRDARLHAAATIVVANALGCEFEDCRLDDEGPLASVALRRRNQIPQQLQGAEAFASVAMIHEAGAMAVAKRHGRSPHRINTEDGAGLIQNSLVWNTSAASRARGPLQPAFMAARCAAQATVRESVGFVAELLLGRDGLIPIDAWHGVDAHAWRLAAGGGSHEMPEALDHVQADAVGFARVLPDADHNLGVGDDGLDVAERRALAHSAHGELALIGERDHHAGEVGLVAPGEGDRGFVHAAGLLQPVLPAFVRRVKFWSRGASGRPAGTKAQNLRQTASPAVSPSFPACA
jgi:hypothetical protein